MISFLKINKESNKEKEKEENNRKKKRKKKKEKKKEEKRLIVNHIFIIQRIPMNWWKLLDVI